MAYLVSFALHALPLLAALIFAVNPPSTVKTPPLIAELRPAPTPTPAAPELHLDTPEPQAEEAKASPPKPTKPTNKSAIEPAKDWQQAIKQHMRKLKAAGQFYPAEAIARNLQGDVDVLIALDENGKVAAARVEQGSGHPILDEAALRSVRSLSALSADAPRQFIFPVRFRLE